MGQPGYRQQKTTKAPVKAYRGVIRLRWFYTFAAISVDSSTSIENRRFILRLFLQHPHASWLQVIKFKNIPLINFSFLFCFKRKEKKKLSPLFRQQIENRLHESSLSLPLFFFFFFSSRLCNIHYPPEWSRFSLILLLLLHPISASLDGSRRPHQKNKTVSLVRSLGWKLDSISFCRIFPRLFIIILFAPVLFLFTAGRKLNSARKAFHYSSRWECNNGNKEKELKKKKEKDPAERVEEADGKQKKKCGQK